MPNVSFGLTDTAWDPDGSGYASGVAGQIVVDKTNGSLVYMTGSGKSGVELGRCVTGGKFRVAPTWANTTTYTEITDNKPSLTVFNNSGGQISIQTATNYSQGPGIYLTGQSSGGDTIPNTVALVNGVFQGSFTQKSSNGTNSQEYTVTVPGLIFSVSTPQIISQSIPDVTWTNISAFIKGVGVSSNKITTTVTFRGKPSDSKTNTVTIKLSYRGIVAI